MRYVKKFVDPLEDDDRPQERTTRFCRRDAPMSPRVTRKMAKIDAELLAIAAGVAEPRDPRASLALTAPPPRAASARLVIPPPLPIPIPFPFPFANAASTTTITTTSDDSFDVHDSWLLSPPQEGNGRYRSLVPREPEPFSLRPPTYSMLPR